MKKISILLFLPLLVLAQPTEDLQNDLAYVDFKMEIKVQLEREVERNSYDFEAQRDAVLMHLKTPDHYNKENLTPIKIVNKGIPKHLNTFSLTGQTKERHESFEPQKRLDNLLAAKDIEFPKENTLFKGLSPVRYEKIGFGGAENIPEGFGPKIRF